MSRGQAVAGLRWLRLLFLNTPVAMVIYSALPSGWAIPTSSVHALHSTGNWLDPSTAGPAPVKMRRERGKEQRVIQPLGQLQHLRR